MNSAPDHFFTSLERSLWKAGTSIVSSYFRTPGPSNGTNRTKSRKWKYEGIRGLCQLYLPRVMASMGSDARPHMGGGLFLYLSNQNPAYTKDKAKNQVLLEKKGNCFSPEPSWWSFYEGAIKENHSLVFLRKVRGCPWNVAWWTIW